MRILIVTQGFLPEMGALSNRLYPITRKLVAEGHDVFVATGMPNYPAGVVFPEYRGRRSFREELDGVTVLRSSHYTVPRNQRKWAQARSYLSFIPAAFRSGLRAGPVDVVLVTSPPLFPVIPAYALAKRRGAKLVFDVRDLWPDEIVACGAAREGSLPVKAIGKLERWAYRVSDAVTCTTRSFMDTAIQRGAHPDKVAMVPNGADLELFRPRPPVNPVSSQLPFGDRFVVMYSGAFGIKHGLEKLILAAHELRDEKDIVFCLVGAGARSDALQEMTRSMGLTNVIFAHERPVAEVPYLLARADVCVSSLMPEPYFDKILSVKIFEYMACGKPVIAAQSGESAQIVEESEAGIVVPPGDECALMDAILQLKRSPSRRDRMARAGLKFVEEKYSREASAATLEKLLREVVGAGRLRVAKPAPSDGAVLASNGVLNGEKRPRASAIRR